MNILPSEGITFKQLERIFFEIGCDVARTLMEQYLLKADEILEKTRDKASLRHKGSRTTSIVDFQIKTNHFLKLFEPIQAVN
jgi:hypothetical protein